MSDYSIAQQSFQGGREYNEDRTAIFVRDETVLLVIADGLGGHAGGEIASQAFVDSVGVTFSAASDELLNNSEEFLRLTINHAHKLVHKRALENGYDVDSPKTTCVLCIVRNGFALWAHSGDSRLYLIRKNNIAASTVDHVTEAASGHRPINRCVGGIDSPRPEISARNVLQKGDVIMLATDGGWASFQPEFLSEYIDPEHPTLGIESLMQMLEAKNSAPSDNLSIVLLHWGIKQLDKPVINQALQSKTNDLLNVSPTPLFDMKDFNQKISEIEDFVNELDKKF